MTSPNNTEKDVKQDTELYRASGEQLGSQRAEGNIGSGWLWEIWYILVNLADYDNIYSMTILKTWKSEVKLLIKYKALLLFYVTKKKSHKNNYNPFL